jgi:hypothetical protein
MRIRGWRTRSVFERYAIVNRNDMADAILRLEQKETQIQHGHDMVTLTGSTEGTKYRRILSPSPVYSSFCNSRYLWALSSSLQLVLCGSVKVCAECVVTKWSRYLRIAPAEMDRVYASALFPKGAESNEMISVSPRNHRKRG